MKKRRFFSAKRITGLAVLLALVIVLQTFGAYFKIGTTSLSFVLVPIVLAGLLYGPFEAGFLGFAFGVVVIIQGLTVDAFTLVLLEDHPVLTSMLCLVKGTAAGVVSGVLYRVLSKKNRYVGVFVASGAAPIVNTGLFILGALLMSDTLSANFVADGQTVLYFLIIICAGVNFLVEFAINLILAPSLNRLLNILGGKIIFAKNVKIAPEVSTKTEQVEINRTEAEGTAIRSSTEELDSEKEEKTE